MAHDTRDTKPGRGEITAERSAMELTLTLTDRQLGEIAARAAALLSTGAKAGSSWLNVAEAAEHLRCGRDRIYDLIQVGKLEPRRDGRRVLLRRDDLDAYVEGRCAARCDPRRPRSS